jgi:DNA-binding response OmpR family regulator
MFMSHHRVCTHDNPCTVLLVEDVDDQADLAIENVRQYGEDGIKLLRARTKAEGLAMAIEKGASLRLILLDLKLPDSRGLQTFLDMKAAADEAVPIVILTNHSDPETEHAAMAAGAQDYVLKIEVADGSRSLVRIIRHSVERQLYRMGVLRAAGVLAGVQKEPDADALARIGEVKQNLWEMLAD